MSEETDIADDVLEQFLSCPVQQMAYHTLVNELLDCEFFWEAGKTEERLDARHPQILMWHNTIRRLIRQMLVYGFVVYRVSLQEAGGARQDDTDTDSLDPIGRPDKRAKTSPPHKIEIKSGDTVQLRYVKRSGSFVAVSSAPGTKSNRIIAHQGDHNIGVPGKWRLQLYETPLLQGQGNDIVPSSPASRAFASSKAHSELMDNILVRDQMNTSAIMMTQVSDRLKAGSGSLNKPWFDNSQNVNASITARPGVGGSALDFDELISDRLDSITALQQMSDTARKQTEKLYQSATVGSRSLHAPQPVAQRHEEMMLTDGFTGNELSYRRAPEDLLSVLERAANDILFQFDVPPQVLGKNINSERLASSNRLSELAVRRYHVSLKTFRSHLSHCLFHISTTIQPGTQLLMKPCVSIFSLTQLLPILKSGAAAKLFACAYDIDETIIDKKALSEFLTLQRNGGKPSTDAKAAVNVGKTDGKSDKQLERVKEKSEKPSANTDATT